MCIRDSLTGASPSFDNDAKCNNIIDVREIFNTAGNRIVGQLTLSDSSLAKICMWFFLYVLKYPSEFVVVNPLILLRFILQTNTHASILLLHMSIITGKFTFRIQIAK